MSSNKLTKDNLDFYLRELAKEYRKLCGKRNPAEIILIGGASILANYNFRNSTEDIDAIIGASTAIKDAANHVGDKYGLPTGWFNSDFEKTTTYSPELILHSKYYKTYSNVVHYRTVSAEYLLAMKLISNRLYKNDKSDVVGIIKAEKELGNNITINDIDRAIKELYGNKVKIDKDVYEELNNTLKETNLENKYQKVRDEEIKNREALLTYIKENPSDKKIDNVEDAIASIRKRMK